ncbi:MAG TPA: FAD-dependent oxidoreductase, partial [Gammaproteobacteria bacterium]|nr:FAD-dependent oxidoreductase [Gammaproteobacteria bacterium]
MPVIKEVKIPDIGDFSDVEIIDVLVAAGDTVNKEDPLITLESDKASMDIPSPHTGKVVEVLVKVGDKVAEGSDIIKMELSDKKSRTTGESKSSQAENVDEQQSAPVKTASEKTSDSDKTADKHCEVLVLGAGPGGYTAAFRAADLGKQTVLVERYDTLGGVCLNVGCIPSKALLHVARVISEIEELKELGIDLGGKKAKNKPVREWTEGVVNKLTSGLKQMAKQRKVDVVHGTGAFTSANTIEVRSNGKSTSISFDYAIIAAGSQAAIIPGLPDDPRILDSTSALLLEKIPGRLLVIGGGIIGLEMATVYEALGSKITVVEMLDALIAGCDKDIVRPLQKRIKSRYENIF